MGSEVLEESEDTQVMPEQTTGMEQATEAEQIRVRKQILRGHALTWLLRLVNLVLFLLLLIVLISVMETGYVLKTEEAQIARQRAHIEELQTDTDELKESIEEEKERYRKAQDLAVMNFILKYGCEWDTARMRNRRIMEALFEGSSYQRAIYVDGSEIVNSEVDWLDKKETIFENPEEKNIMLLNLYRGQMYESNQSELLQTIILQDFDGSVAADRDYNFDGYPDMVLQDDIIENGEDTGLYRHQIYLWNPVRNEFIYGGTLTGVSITPAAREKRLYCNQGTWKSPVYELWRFEQGRLRYLGMEEKL